MDDIDGPVGPTTAGLPASDCKVAVAIGGRPFSDILIRQARHLADTIGSPWVAVHVETPSSDRDTESGVLAASALAHASRLGATIVSIPAASVADGLSKHISETAIEHLVIGHNPARKLWRSGTVAKMLQTSNCPVLHIYPDASEPTRGSDTMLSLGPAGGLKEYALAALLVGITLAIAEVLLNFLSVRPLDLLFLFPVIAIAVRVGLRPAIFAVALSVVCYNYFLLLPTNSFDLAAPHNLVMAGALTAIALYTSALTARMRRRAVLSDRSARENASIAALGQRLSRDEDWPATAATICEHLNHLLNVRVSVFREVEGELSLVSSRPRDVLLGPVDRAALDWAWSNKENAGAGLAMLAAADWQFHPLKTSLGVLAVVGVAADDGRDPLRADQKILFETLISQCALALERLRMEDLIRNRQ